MDPSRLTEREEFIYGSVLLFSNVWLFFFSRNVSILLSGVFFSAFLNTRYTEIEENPMFRDTQNL